MPDSRVRRRQKPNQFMKRWTANQTRMWLAGTAALISFALVDTSDARPELFIPDPIAGYALSGHDPVAYFVDGFPRKGDRSFVHEWGGAEWVFVNEGNMAAFKNAPETYAPAYAGCGAFALAEGFATAGNPHIFAFVDGRLTLFHSVVNRFLFMVNMDRLSADAAENARKTGCEPQR